MRSVTMATAHSPATSLRSVLGWTAGVAVVWILAALLRPETTLHLGPVFVPLLPVFLLWRRDDAVQGVFGGVAIGALTIAILLLTGNLDGPPLEPFGDPLTESVVVLAGTAIVAVVLARIGRRS